MLEMVSLKMLLNSLGVCFSVLRDMGLLTHLTLTLGNFHTAVMCPPEQKHQAREIITWVQRLAIDMDGTVTGEHGIGLEFRDAMVEEIGENGVDMMRQIKLALDPLCLLNPDKLFRLRIEKADD